MGNSNFSTSFPIGDFLLFSWEKEKGGVGEEKKRARW